MACTIDGVQLETQEMHGRGLVVVLPLQVLVGDREHPLHLADPHPAAIFDADQIAEGHAPLLGIGEFEQQRHLPVAAVGNQRVVGIELVLDPVALEDPLGAQHLEDLIADGGAVLETPGHVGADLDVAQLFVRDDLIAQPRPLERVLLEAHQIASAIVFAWASRSP